MVYPAPSSTLYPAKEYPNVLFYNTLDSILYAEVVPEERDTLAF